MDYIKRIEKTLKEKKITAKKMLIDLGYSDSLISTWKKGSEPSAIKLLRICKYLNISIEYVLTGTAQTENLSETDKEILCYFHKLSEREQLKEIARLELITEEKDERLDNTKLSS